MVKLTHMQDTVYLHKCVSFGGSIPIPSASWKTRGAASIKGPESWKIVSIISTPCANIAETRSFNCM